MADEEQLAILKEGVEAWNAWRQESPEAPVKLIDADLTRAYLEGADLGGANLTGAQLIEANLSSADLTAAKRTTALLIEANLTGVDLTGADLTGADLHHAVLYRTAFSNVDLRETRGLEACEFRGPCSLDPQTLAESGMLPVSFLRGCGWPDLFIEYLPSLLNQPIQFYSCFISYSHADKSFARRLHDQLQGRGIRCWLDEHQLVPGDRVADKIATGIRIWDKVLLCCSETSLASRWVDGEIRIAFDKEQRLAEERDKDVRALIPLMLDDSFKRWEHAYAAGIRGRLAADFTDWETDNAKFEAQFERVVKALRAGDWAKAPPPESKL